MNAQPKLSKLTRKKFQLFSISGNFQKKVSYPPIKIASAHIHIPRNNTVKFHNSQMDSLGGVADTGSLYMYV